MKPENQLQTMALTYQDICQGEQPWVALGNFMNAWFDYARDRRMELVATPISLPEHPTEELLRWAVFCAASVDYLCTRAALPCPSWVRDSRFAPLPEPWFHAPMAQKLSVRAYLLESTPEPFRRRNIYCGHRVFATKYDLAEQHHHRPATRPPTTAPISPS